MFLLSFLFLTFVVTAEACQSLAFEQSSMNHVIIHVSLTCILFIFFFQFKI